MITKETELIKGCADQRRTSRWAGSAVVVGWFLLICSISALSASVIARAKEATAAEVLLLQLVFPCPAVMLLAFALFRGERATRISALLGLGFAVFIFYCILS